MILIDTSVWVDHLRSSNPGLKTLLEQGAAGTHSFVIGELALGHLRRGEEILTLLAALPRAHEAAHEEVLRFVHAHTLRGSGVGWVDAHLLAAARLAGWRLWTLDRHLAAVAARLDLELRPPTSRK